MTDKTEALARAMCFAESVRCMGECCAGPEACWDWEADLDWAKDTLDALHELGYTIAQLEPSISGEKAKET